MHIQPYLYFDGRCDEAIAFYGEALGARLLMRMRFGEAPAGAECPGMTPPPEMVMHACLQIGDSQLLCSDGSASGHPEFKGVTMTLNVRDDAQARNYFDALADGGQVQLPLTENFFATSFGMVTDRLGVAWSVVAARPAAAA